MPLPLLAMAGPILQGVGGLAQTIFGGSRAHKAEKALQNLQTPVYEQSKAIGDYYNQALSRYNTNPYQTQQYQMQQNQIQGRLGAGLNALKGRGGAVAGVSRLAAQGNDASLQAGAAAERQQSQNFAQLGQASQMKAGEDRASFQYNKLAPYQKQYSLLAQKAAGGNQMMNAGIQNLFGGTSTLGQMKFDDYLTGKYFGNQNRQAA